MSCVFGPVPSRRLGRSLGVDVVPFKTCSYNCIYCQLGRTTRTTVQRHEWVSLDGVVAEVREKLHTNPDHITISGSGEPTLYSRLGELIRRIRDMTDTPVAVLSNGSLFWMPEVRHDLLDADVVMPSLDAGDEAMFKAVNRPHAGIHFETMLEGLIRFRNEYRGKYWLEVLLTSGHTDSDAEVARLVEAVRRIGPDRIQLNTVSRPPAEEFALGLTPERLAQIASQFEPPAEVIAEFRGDVTRTRCEASTREVLDLIKRHPCTIADITAGLGLMQEDAQRLIAELESLALAIPSVAHGKTYYKAVESAGDQPR